MILAMIGQEEDTDVLLQALGANPKGNYQFKKLNIRRLLKKTTGMEVMNEVARQIHKNSQIMAIYGESSAAAIIRDLKNAGGTDFNIYAILYAFYPDFVWSNQEKMMQNIQEGKEAFYGISGADNSHDLELFYLQSNKVSYEMSNRFSAQCIYEWFVEYVGALEPFTEITTGIDLESFDRLVNARTMPETLHIYEQFLVNTNRDAIDETVYKAEIEELKDTLNNEGVKVALYLTFYQVGTYNEGLKTSLLEKIDRYAAHFQGSFFEGLAKLDKAVMEAKYEQLEKKYESEQAIMSQMGSSHQKSLSKVTEKLEKIKIENEDLQASLGKTNQELAHANKQLGDHFVHLEGYKKSLLVTYPAHTFLFVHHADFHFAPDIFPEVAFVKLDAVNVEDIKNYTCVFIQSLAGSVKEKKAIERAGNASGKSIHWLTGMDERELIVEMGQLLKGGQLS